jgi:hypothetical protein
VETGSDRWRTVKSRQLDQLPDGADSADVAKILMPDNRLGHAFGLLLGRAVFLQLVERKVTAVELKR